MIQGTQTYHYHHSATGHTLAITDSNETIVNQYAYSPYGRILGETETSGLEQPFKYVGKYGVQHEGNELYYMRARYYDAKTGRFIKEDPIGIEGGLNVSLYGNANPVVYIDPEGLMGLGPGLSANNINVQPNTNLVITDPVLRSIVSHAAGGAVTAGIVSAPTTAGIVPSMIVGGVFGGFVGLLSSGVQDSSVGSAYVGSLSSNGSTRGIVSGAIAGAIGTNLPSNSDPIASSGIAGFVGGGLAGGPLGAVSGLAGGLTTGFVDQCLVQ